LVSAIPVRVARGRLEEYVSKGYTCYQDVDFKVCRKPINELMVDIVLIRG
jgi:hypothetical protein